MSCYALQLRWLEAWSNQEFLQEERGLSCWHSSHHPLRRDFWEGIETGVIAKTCFGSQLHPYWSPSLMSKESTKTKNGQQTCLSHGSSQSCTEPQKPRSSRRPRTPQWWCDQVEWNQQTLSYFPSTTKDGLRSNANEGMGPLVQSSPMPAPFLW